MTASNGLVHIAPKRQDSCYGPTPVLLVFYSRSTRILLDSYPSPARLLHLETSRKHAETAGKGPLSTIRKARRKKFGPRRRDTHRGGQRMTRKVEVEKIAIDAEQRKEPRIEHGPNTDFLPCSIRVSSVANARLCLPAKAGTPIALPAKAGTPTNGDVCQSCQRWGKEHEKLPHRKSLATIELRRPRRCVPGAAKLRGGTDRDKSDPSYSSRSAVRLASRRSEMST